MMNRRGFLSSLARLAAVAPLAALDTDRPAPQRQIGSTSVLIAPDGRGRLLVTFPRPFRVAPVVVATLAMSDPRPPAPDIGAPVVINVGVPNEYAFTLVVDAPGFDVINVNWAAFAP